MLRKGGDVQSFSARVRELPYIVHPKFYVNFLENKLLKKNQI
jgi:hypothetical protein